ncbi:MAG: hypothetical protein RLZZ175_1083 [Bacteroidota bacterium]|jgi:uncharacterized protein
MFDINEIVAKELSISKKQVEATLALLDEGATVPFISRYRKEVTGSLDEVEVAAIRDRALQLRELEKRKEAVIKSLTENKFLTPDLEKKVRAAQTMAELEDIYLPYKPKRRTRATQAKEKGLEPLANLLFAQEKLDVFAEAEKYISAEKGVEDIHQALQGARDIISEWVSEQQEVRASVRELFVKTAIVKSKVIAGKEDVGEKYKDYFEWDESIKDIPSHRLLALRRAEKEGILMLEISPVDEDAVALVERQVLKGHYESTHQVKLAIGDSYKRLIKPSIETDVRLLTKAKADEEAIKVFASNVKTLLMAAPLGQKRVLAIDPGFRTGCKVVCLNEQGKLEVNEVIYPHDSQAKLADAEAKIRSLVIQFKIEAIAIGNGTAGRETESFIRGLKLENVLVVMVNESGASIYSASDIAREEFPDQDITVRGSVSIGRRLMDPLAELVKIDPKSIGVGQYQHDVEQNKLKHMLDDVVMSCVNAVGVEVNTASKQLLTYVSGLGPALAQNIVEYRNANGPFKSRTELKKVPRLGEKVFEQAAGFLRINNAKNILDSSAVHPESYAIVEKMAKDLGCKVQDLIANAEIRKGIDLKKYVTDKVGLPTLTDILQELAKPGRDPRDGFEVIQFAEGVNSIADLKVGMELTGVVTNVTAFGAFVDIGVHQDGLVHISQLSDTFISDPNQAVKVQQKVKVKVQEVDVQRKRISLTMKGLNGFTSSNTKTEKTAKSTTARTPIPAKKETVKESGNQLQDQLQALKNKFK